MVPSSSQNLNPQFWANGGNRYRWLSLVIKLDLNSADFDLKDFAIENFRPEMHHDEFLGPVVHEYTHFLQNVGTLWGARMVYDLILGVFLLSCSAQNGDFEMKGDGSNLIKSVKGRIPGVQLMTPLSTDLEYCFTWRIGISTVVISTACLEVSVDILSICEGWARCATKLYLGLGDDAIHEDNESFDTFHSGGGPKRWNQDYEYWILFEYFYQNGYQNVAIGLCRLCAYVMNYFEPAEAFLRFAHFSEGDDSDDLNDIAKRWYKSPSEIVPRSESWKSMIRKYDKLIELDRKHGKDNDVIRDLSRLAEYVRAVLSEDADIFLKGIDNIRTPLFWAERFKSIGTPVLAFNDETVVWGPTKHLRPSFLDLVGMAEVMNNRESPEFACVFLDERPICIAVKDYSLCGRTPYLRKPWRPGILLSGRWRT